MKLVQAYLLVTTLCFWSTCWGALPLFSWDTVPVFFHSSNSTGPYSKEALKAIAKYPMVTIEKWMGINITNVDDEDEMAVTMKAVKAINPKVATYFYMDLTKNRPEMTRMYREFFNNSSFALKAPNGQPVKIRGKEVFDLSNVKVRQWWLNTCLNATKFSNGDGCFCDGSVVPPDVLDPAPSPAKLKAWNDGLFTLTRDVQNALGTDKLLIGKSVTQPFVKAAQIENFRADGESIHTLLTGAQNGLVVQAHVPVTVPCTSDLTDYLAAFLIGAGERTYFGCGNWHAEGNVSTPFMWHPVYDKPLGEPVTPPTYEEDTRVWSREFKSGTKVTFDTKNNKGTIQWGS